MELTPLASNTPAASTDDFFDTWDKPAAKPAATTKPSPAGPPSIGRPVVRAASSSASTPAARASPVTRPTATRLGTGPKVSKLGAKKASSGINFEEAQKKALEEEERVKRLGYDKLKEEEEAKAVKEREAAEKKKRGEEVSRSSTPSNPVSAARREADKPAVARLGFGQTIGQAAPAQTKT